MKTGIFCFNNKTFSPIYCFKIFFSSVLVMDTKHYSLPRVIGSDLPIYSAHIQCCSGLVHLKCRNQVIEGPPCKWPRYLLAINLSISDDTNYVLCCERVTSHSDACFSHEYHLANCSVAQITPQLVELYASHLAKGSPVSIWSHSTETATAWKETLEKVIAVATERDKRLRGVYTKKALEKRISERDGMDLSDSADSSTHTDIDLVLKPAYDWHLGDEVRGADKFRMLI
jgi:hypothetical protein